MKAKILGLIVIILLIILAYIIVKPDEEPVELEQSIYVSTKDLYNNPTKYLNQTVFLTGKIWKVDPYNFASGIVYFQDQIRGEYRFFPLENKKWSPNSNNHYTQLQINIYHNNLSLDEYIQKEILLIGILREYPPEFHFEDSAYHRYYVEVVNIIIIN